MTARRDSARILATMLIAWTGGCAGSDGDTGEPGSLVRLEEVARYGSLDEAGASLTRVADLVVIDARAYVLEADPPRVAVFDSDGTWRRDLGGAGDGPGELRQPRHIGRVGDRIWVGDPSGRRLEVYDREGAPIASYRWDVPPDSLGFRAFPTALLSDGAVLAGPGRQSISELMREGAHRDYYRATPDGRTESVLYRAEVAGDDFFTEEMGSDGMELVGQHPFQESPLVDVFPDGSGLVAVERPEAESGESAEYRIRVIAADGTAEVDRTVEYTPVAATGWLDEYVAEAERGMIERQGSASPDVLEAFRNGPAERTFYPPVTELRVGSDGTIWVRREETPADSVRWDIFERSGERVGEVWTDQELEIIHPSLAEVWAVEPDELDVPYVVRLRVSR